MLILELQESQWRNSHRIIDLGDQNEQKTITGACF